jgi:hypothetical protein
MRRLADRAEPGPVLCGRLRARPCARLRR